MSELELKLASSSNWLSRLMGEDVIEGRILLGESIVVSFRAKNSLHSFLSSMF